MAAMVAERGSSKPLTTFTPFLKLPTDLILEIMRHTNIYTLPNLVRCGKAIHEIYEHNKSACLHGIETEQFPDIIWLFGDDKGSSKVNHRTTEQSQAIKDFIATNPHSAVFPRYLRSQLDIIDNDQLTPTRHVQLMQVMKGDLETFIGIWSARRFPVGVRSGLCLLRMTFRRAEIMPIQGGLTMCFRMPVDERIIFFEQQPAMVRNKVHKFLTMLVYGLIQMLKKLGHVDTIWLLNVCSISTAWMNSEVIETREIISSTAVAIILEKVLDIYMFLPEELIECCSDWARDPIWLLMTNPPWNLTEARRFCNRITRLSRCIELDSWKVLGLPNQSRYLVDRLLSEF